MKKSVLAFILSIVIQITMAHPANNDTTNCAEVELETTAGNIRIRLSNDTPLHRDNFLKLVKKHFYDSLLFHRTIPQFMVQAGDPASKKADPGVSLGSTTLDYTLPAEIRYPQLYHKRGAVAAAREADNINPEHRSDACQFYIVWGKPFSTSVLEKQRERIDTLFKDSVTMPKAVFDTYRKIGGTPHLDGTYTVFGEVIKGLDVVEKIQKAETDDYDRPLDDIRIIKAEVVKDLPVKSKSDLMRKR